mgnify:CR=1 FL=1
MLFDCGIINNIKDVISMGDIDMLNYVLSTNHIKSDELKNIIDIDGNNALHWCGTINGENLTLYLILLGININKYNNKKQLPLHIHSLCNCLYGVTCLLSNGSIINAYCDIEYNTYNTIPINNTDYTNNSDLNTTNNHEKKNAFMNPLGIAELYKYNELKIVLLRYNAKKL